MKNTLRIGHIFVLIALAFVVGCSGDSTVTSPPPDPVDPAGTIGVYMDQAGTNSNITDTGGIVTLYVVHRAPAVTASEFKVEAPTGWILFGAQPQFAVSIGDIDKGIAIAYGQCLNDVVFLITLTYQCPGNTPVGESFKVLPRDNGLGRLPYTEVRVVDCESNLLFSGVGLESQVVVVP